MRGAQGFVSEEQEGRGLVAPNQTSQQECGVRLGQACLLPFHQLPHLRLWSLRKILEAQMKAAALVGFQVLLQVQVKIADTGTLPWAARDHCRRLHAGLSMH